jgi:hypothetical protein
MLDGEPDTGGADELWVTSGALTVRRRHNQDDEQVCRGLLVWHTVGKPNRTAGAPRAPRSGSGAAAPLSWRTKFFRSVEDAVGWWRRHADRDATVTTTLAV